MNSNHDIDELITTVVLVSLHGAMRKSLRAIVRSVPDVDLVGTASGGLTAHALIQQYKPDLVVIDADLPADEVTALIQGVKKTYPTTGSIVLTATSRHREMAVSAGVDAAISRTSSVSDIVNTMRDVQHAVHLRQPVIEDLLDDEAGDIF